jgi:hypothetical protein
MYIQSDGRHLVIQILDRRRARCANAGTHTIVHCRACGIHDKAPPQRPAPKGDPKS